MHDLTIENQINEDLSQNTNEIDKNIIRNNVLDNTISIKEVLENGKINEDKATLNTDNRDVESMPIDENVLTNNSDKDELDGIDKPEVPVKFNAEIVEDEVFSNKKYLKFKLSQFEGPLDLLCTLVKENKVEIEDIFISDITGQYLEIVTNSSFDDVEYASEFLIMAATLLEIKSKRLLPVVEDNIDGEVDPDYDEKMIIRQVKEYKLFKETSEKLAENEALYQFTKEPVYTEDDYRIALKDFDLNKLVDAFAKILTRAEMKAEEIKPKTIIKERYTVSNRIKHIARNIFELKKMNFFDLYDEDFTKIEVINTFLAILELLKRQYITATQETQFSDIFLELKDGVDTMLDVDDGEVTEEYK